MAARRKGRKIAAPSRAFETIAAHISSFEKNSKSSEDRRALSEETSKMIGELGAELAGGGKALRQRVESYLRIMAGSRRDELSGMIVEFKNPDSGVSVTLAEGEAEKPAAKAKMDDIVKDCISTAKTDLAFLKKMQSLLEDDKKGLSAEQISQLGLVLGRNSYWRFFESG